MATSFRLAIAVVLLVAVAWYLYEHRDDIFIVSALSLQVILLAVTARAIAFIAAVQANFAVIRLFTPVLGKLEFLVLSSGGLLLGHLAPPGSTYAAKSIYLKRRHNLGHQQFLAVSLVVGFLALATSGAIALLALGIIWAASSEFPALSWVAALTMLIPTAIFLRFPHTFSALLGRVKKLGGLARTWNHLRSARGSIWHASIFLLGRALASFVGFGVLFMALTGGSDWFLRGGVVDALSAVLRLVRLSPGNLGIYEWMVAGFGHDMGAALSTGLVAAASYRLAGMVGVALVALIALGLQNIQQRSDHRSLHNRLHKKNES